jgi:hypothetical protein
VDPLGQARRPSCLTYELDDLYDRLPRLRDSPHRVTSSPDEEYNCVAWVRRELKRYYAPGLFWPHDIVPEPKANEDDLDAFVTIFETWGYGLCDSSEYEPGFLKIAIYAKERKFHHVAKQLRTGAWSSKIGEAHDVRHEQLDALEDAPVFFDRASATVFMRRIDDGVDQLEIEERGYLLPDADW